MGKSGGLGALLACAMICVGCGFGVGQGFTHSTMGPRSSLFSDTPGPSSRVGFARINTITAYDTTGILLAALGTAGNAANAQAEAEAQARASGAQAGDTYSYSYEVVQPAAGTNTYLTLGFGNTSSGTFGEVDFSDSKVSYWLLDLRSTLVNWDLVADMKLSMFLGAFWESWSGQVPGGEIDSTWIGMPLGVSLNYPLLSFLSVTPRLAVDPLIGPLGGLLSEGGHWLWLEAGVRLDVRPVDWLLIFVDAVHRITPWELGNATGTTTQFNAGIAYMYNG